MRDNSIPAGMQQLLAGRMAPYQGRSDTGGTMARYVGPGQVDRTMRQPGIEPNALRDPSYSDTLRGPNGGIDISKLRAWLQSQNITSNNAQDFMRNPQGAGDFPGKVDLFRGLDGRERQSVMNQWLRRTGQEPLGPAGRNDGVAQVIRDGPSAFTPAMRDNLGLNDRPVRGTSGMTRYMGGSNGGARRPDERGMRPEIARRPDERGGGYAGPARRPNENRGDYEGPQRSIANLLGMPRRS